MAGKGNNRNRPSRGKPVLTAATVAPLVERFLGNLAGIAKALGVSRQAVHKFVTTTPSLAAAVDAERERVKDLIEQSLVKKAILGESWAVCFFLKTQARDRGYTEREPDLPPLEVLLAALPTAVADVVRKALAAAVHPGPDPGGGPAPDG